MEKEFVSLEFDDWWAISEDLIQMIGLVDSESGMLNHFWDAVHW